MPSRRVRPVSFGWGVCPPIRLDGGVVQPRGLNPVAAASIDATMYKAFFEDINQGADGRI